LQVERGGKRLSISADFEIQHPTSVIGISYFFKNLSQSPQPSQSLVIPELQVSEVLDGADHLRGVAVLVRRFFDDDSSIPPPKKIIIHPQKYRVQRAEPA